MRVKCLAQGYNTMTRSGLEPGPLDSESSAQTTRPPRLTLFYFRFMLWEILENLFDGLASHPKGGVLLMRSMLRKPAGFLAAQ